MLVSLGILLGGSYDLLGVLRRLSVVFKLSAGLVDCEANFALEDLRCWFSDLRSCLKVLALLVTGRIQTILVASLARLAFSIEVSLRLRSLSARRVFGCSGI